MNPKNKNSSNNNGLPLWQQYIVAEQARQRGPNDPLTKLDGELKSASEKFHSPFNLDEWCPKLQAGDKEAAERTVKLASKTFSDAEIVRICQAAQDNPHVTMMNFFNTPLDENGVIAMGEFLGKTRSLTHLDISHTRLCARDVLRICFALKNCRTLQHVNMYGLPMMDAAASCLADALAQRSDLTHLNLWKTNIGNAGVTMILDALAKNPRPFCLVLDNNRRNKLSPEVQNRLSNTPGLIWKNAYQEAKEVFSELLHSMQETKAAMEALLDTCILSNPTVNDSMNRQFGN